jgi:ADP-heptose:LPS heptosyltransferase
MEHQLQRCSSYSASTPIIDKNHLAGLQKIAVLQASTPGDFLFTLPAIISLHAAYPQAEIVLLGRPWHVAFLKDRPSPIQRVVAIPPYHGISANVGCWVSGSKLAAFFAVMRREHFDLALQLQDSSQYANTFINQLGAHKTVGRCEPGAPKPDHWLPHNCFQHKLLRQLEIIKLVSSNERSEEPHNQPYLSVTATDIKIAEATLPSTQQPLVIIHPGAPDPRHRWSPQKFAVIGDILAERGASVIVTGNRRERALAAEVTRKMHAPACNLSGKLSLNGLIGLLTRSRLVVANEADLLHLASAIGTPAISIYWCMNLLHTGPLTRQHHHPHISWQLTCPICGKHCLHEHCAHNASLVDDITIDEVSESVKQLYQTP